MSLGRCIQVADSHKYNLFREWRAVVKLYLRGYTTGDDSTNCPLNGSDYSISVLG